MSNDSEYIKVEKLNKYYGKAHILKDISVSFEKGKIHGIIGRNGSGKTQLFKCLSGVVIADSGSIYIDGKKLYKDIDTPGNIGVILETPGFLNNYSGYKNLEILYSIRNKKDKNTKKYLREILAKVCLEQAANKKTGKYSMGMRQSLVIAQAFMENQEFLILDEPMNGLDNRGVEDMRKLFKELRDQGKTILLASHNRDDIDLLCDYVYQMDSGVLTYYAVNI